MKCVACEATKLTSQGQWWHLKNYFGFTGTFCPDCYDKISHNSYWEPNNPHDYLLMLLKQEGVKNAQLV